MPLPVPTESPACAICGGLLADGPTIATTTDGAVHMRCAEEQARAAARRRRVRAALSGVVGVGVWGLALEGGAMRAEDGAIRAVLLALLLVAIHVLINRRWWGYTVQAARRWWRWR